MGKPKVHINYIKNNEPEKIYNINHSYSTNNLSTQFEMLKKCTNYMLLSIRGLWAKNEALFHIAREGINKDDEQETIV